MPFPYDATCSWGAGARFGPARLLEASHQVEWYDEETQGEPCRAGVCTLRPLEPVASGPEAYLSAVTRQVRAVLDADLVPVGIGGEHSITLGIVRALRQELGETFTVLQLDAHLDLRDSFQESRFSHACVMKRVLEAGLQVVQVGVRSGSSEEWDLARSGATTVFHAAQIVPAPPQTWIPKVLDSISTPGIYITVDLDGFDPSVIPGTGTPEPGGLGYWQGLALLRALARDHKVLGFDIVELDPLPGSRVSEMAAARLTYKLLGYCLAGDGNHGA